MVAFATLNKTSPDRVRKHKNDCPRKHKHDCPRKVQGIEKTVIVFLFSFWQRYFHNSPTRLCFLMFLFFGGLATLRGQSKSIPCYCLYLPPQKKTLWSTFVRFQGELVISHSTPLKIKAPWWWDLRRFMSVCWNVETLLGSCYWMEPFPTITTSIFLGNPLSINVVISLLVAIGIHRQTPWPKIKS